MVQTDTNETPGAPRKAAAPEVEAPVVEAGDSADQRGWAPNVSRKKLALGAVVILAGVLAALYAWGLTPLNSGAQTTNNAYVRGNTTGLRHPAPRHQGAVA